MQDQLQKQFNEAQQEIMDARLSKDQKSKDIDHWQQRFLNLSDWTSDQWSLMSVPGKISADPAILEPQRQQVGALLSEFNSRKERYNQLQARFKIRVAVQRNYSGAVAAATEIFRGFLGGCSGIVAEL